MAKFLSNPDNLKNPIFWAFVGGFVAVFAVLTFVLNQNNTISFVGAGLIVGSIGLLYNDFVEKNKLKDQEDVKMEELIRKKKEQAEMEQQEGKCISCLAELPAEAKECPECGFEVKHYSVEAEQAEA